MKTIYLLAAFLIGCSSALASSDDILNKSDQFYYLSLFSGDFPIPVRYGITVPKSEPEKKFILSLKSPIINTNNLSLEQQLQQLKMSIGYIMVGVYPPEEESTGSIELVEEETLYGLNIKHFKRSKNTNKNRKPSLNSLVVISDKVNYLLLMDEDPELWKRLLRLYGELNNKKR